MRSGRDGRVEFVDHRVELGGRVARVVAADEAVFGSGVKLLRSRLRLADAFGWRIMRKPGKVETYSRSVMRCRGISWGSAPMPTWLHMLVTGTMEFSVMRSPLERTSTESRVFAASRYIAVRTLCVTQRFDHARRPGGIELVRHRAVLDVRELRLGGPDEDVAHAAQPALQAIDELLAIGAVHQRLAEAEVGDDWPGRDRCTAGCSAIHNRVR